MPVPVYFGFSPVPYRQGPGYAKLGAAHKKTHQPARVNTTDRRTCVKRSDRQGLGFSVELFFVTPSQKAERCRGRMNEREKYNCVTSWMPKGESGEDK